MCRLSHFNPHPTTWVLVQIHLTNEVIEAQRLSLSPRELKLWIAVLRLTFRLSPDLFPQFTAPFCPHIHCS